MMHEKVKMTILFVMASSPTLMGRNIILVFPSLEASFLRGVYRLVHTSKMENFETNVNNLFFVLTFATKLSILDACSISGYVSF